MSNGDDTSFSRRQIVGGLGASLAAMAAPVSAQTTSATSTAQPLQGPPDKYPKPPYKSQSQPWPGLASKMDPPPDHGETIYKGSGRLMGRKALITGGDSGMGRAAAIAYAREGADVAIVYYPTEEPDAQQVIALIKAEGRKAIAIPGDLRHEKFCVDLVGRALNGLGGLDIVVSNAGRQQQRDSILDLTTEDFDSTMKTNIYAPFWIIKTALPHLPPGSTIIATTSEQAYDPSPDLYVHGCFLLGVGRCISALKRGMYMPNASWRRWGVATASRGVSPPLQRERSGSGKGGAKRRSAQAKRGRLGSGLRTRGDTSP